MTKLKGSHKSTQKNDQLTSHPILTSNFPSHRDLLSENLPVKKIRSATIEDNAAEKSSKGWIITKSGFKLHVKFPRKQKHDVTGSEHDLGGKLTSSNVNKQLADSSVMTAQNSENEHENRIEEAKGVDGCFCDDDTTSNAMKKNACFNPHFSHSPDYMVPNWRKLNLLADMCSTIVESRCSLRSSSCLGDIGRDQLPEDGNNGCYSPKALFCHEKVLHCGKHVTNTITKLPNKNLDAEQGQDNEGFHEFGTVNEDCIPKSTCSKGHDSHEEVWHHEKYDSYSETSQNENVDEVHKQHSGIGNVGNHESTSLKKLIGHVEVLHCEKPDEEPTDVNMDKIEKNIQRDFPNICNAEEDADISSDSEGHHNERTDIAREKNSFPFSQSTYSQRSIATTDLRELKVCVKCHEGGKLLVCSSKPCPLVIHEKCLGFDASFDTEARFHCPFCEYSRAISEYNNIKKKVSLARKDFSTFICSGTGKELKKPWPRSCSMERHHLEEDDFLNNKDIPKDINSCLRKIKVVDSNDGTSHKLDNDKIESTEKKTVDAEELSEEENGNSRVSTHSVRVQKRKRKDYNQAIPKSRRKRIAWTIAEEDTLKEGMQRFFSPCDPYIPWKKILEFGADVFHSNRSTIDLKDKWRNLCKTSPHC